jgi:hypothetical protein
MAGQVVLIEGLDLAGKSTLVRNLQAELTRRGIPVRVSRNALCPDNPIAALADQVRRDPEAGIVETGALFLAAHLWDARHFTPPPDGTIHLQDSCWLRTFAYHTWKATPAIPEQLARAARYFPRFDAAVGSRRDMVMALGASVLETHMLTHKQTGRDVVELLADVLAELLADGVATGAQALRFGQLVLHALAWQILGQRLAAMPLAWGLW